MRQQVNLYQPATRDQTRQVSAGSLVIGLGVLAACLVGVSQFATHRVAVLERGVNELRTQQAAQEQRMARATELSGKRADAATVAARLQQLTTALSERERALALLQSGGAGQTTGFAARMEALARRHVSGLWLDSVSLSGTTASMSLQGSTTNPDVVPLYLQSLADDPVLAGTRFDQFVIERPQPQGSEVRAGSIAAEPTAPAQEGVLRFRAGNAAIPTVAREDGRS